MKPHDKWKANQDKVTLLKSFPGLLTSWEQADGLTLEHTMPFLDQKPYTALVFSDGRFGISSHLVQEPQLLTSGLQLVRPLLEDHYPESFQEYDRLHAVDQEVGRQLRLENIMNAIDHNAASIPELKSRIRDLVRRWDS